MNPRLRHIPYSIVHRYYFAQFVFSFFFFIFIFHFRRFRNSFMIFLFHVLHPSDSTTEQFFRHLFHLFAFFFILQFSPSSIAQHETLKAKPKSLIIMENASEANYIPKICKCIAYWGYWILGLWEQLIRTMH